MAPFHPLYISRSDGILEVVSKNKREKNEPTAEQLDQTPDAKGVADYYRPLGYEEAKHLDWRRKLGAMLVRELGSKEQLTADKAYILYDLPENYRLFEHIKSKAKNENGEEVVRSTKNHSGGGHDRQDAYLYGHPQGRKKRYRSPGDFFPHLLWLTTDPEGDPNNCSCKVCSPDDLQPDEPKPAPVKREASEPVAINPAARPSAPQNPHTPTPRPPSVQAPAASASKPPSNAPQSQQPTPLPRPTVLDQQIDLEYGNLVYRQGELVWFNRGEAWGLGIVTRRFTWLTDPQRPIRVYVVQPLSHPFQAVGQVAVTSEEGLRPWLKWSAPNLMTPGLAQLPNISYDTTDWHAVLNGAFGDRANAEVDASILAARAIDMSYTLMKQIDTSKPEPGVQDRRFTGIFFGGEKMWLGDPARLNNRSGVYVLVLSEIIERAQAAANQRPVVSIFFIGDIFRLSPITNPQQDRSPGAAVPARMIKDLEVRNSICRSKFFWKHTATQAMYPSQAIRGRWYETSVLTPRMEPNVWQAAVASGNIAEACEGWNNRGDAQRDGDKRGILIPKASRVEALGKAVPQGTTLVEGVEAPPPVEIANMLSGNHAQNQEEQQDPDPMPMEQGFLDFGNDDMPAYHSNFGGGHSGHGSFFG